MKLILDMDKREDYSSAYQNYALEILPKVYDLQSPCRTHILKEVLHPFLFLWEPESETLAPAEQKVDPTVQVLPTGALWMEWP